MLLRFQSTFALRTPRYYGHPAIAYKSPPSANPDSHNINRHYDKGKQRNHSPILQSVRGATLETSLLRSYVLFHIFRDKSIYFSFVPCYYGMSLSRTLNSLFFSPPRAGVRNNGSELYYFASFKIRTFTLPVLGDNTGQEPNHSY